MINSANDYSISALFGIEGNIVYDIPIYQREYSWRKKDWENLFEDICENKKGYFLGSIICINRMKDSLEVQKLELVDGQQRMVTISLLFAAAYSLLKEEECLDDDEKTELNNLKRRLILHRSKQQILTPQMQNHNLDDYKAVLCEAGITNDGCEAPPYAGNRQIFRAYRHFQNCIKGKVSEQKSKVKEIIDFLEKVTSACLVKIEVKSYADAYTLFSSLNNRGMPLTAVDIIKNKLLGILHEKYEDNQKIENYYDKWNRMLDYVGDDYVVQERFFRQYYNAFKSELQFSQTPMVTRSNLIEVYEKLITSDPDDFLNKIFEASRLYSQILLNNPSGISGEVKKQLEDLKHIQGAPSYLLLLYLFAHKDKLQLDDNGLRSTAKLLVRFFVRRNLTDTPPTRDLTRLFMDIVGKINERGFVNEGVKEIIKTELMSVSASNAEFKKELEGPIYDENRGVARFILCALAEEGMTKETRRDLWEMKGNNYFWTIEHIFPQGRNIPKPWVDMVARGNKEKAKEIQQTHTHKLGNLTLSGFNTSLGNKIFEEKRDRKNKAGNYIGYKNGLSLNESLARAESWSVEQIDERTEQLVQQAIELFKSRGGG